MNYSQERDLNNLVATRKHQKNPKNYTSFFRKCCHACFGCVPSGKFFKKLLRTRLFSLTFLYYNGRYYINFFQISVFLQIANLPLSFSQIQFFRPYHYYSARKLVICPKFFWIIALFLHTWRFELDSFQSSKNQTLFSLPFC